jgi:hypothetical protein
MTIHPIQFCIDESKFLPLRPVEEKILGFSPLIPGDVSTYIFNDEKTYMQNYAECYYGLTWRKAGWDCMRHIEIIAAGAIPYFCNIERCPPSIMTLLPKELIIQAMNLPGVHEFEIDFSIFDKSLYDLLRKQIYEHARRRLTCKAMATNILNEVEYGWGSDLRVLFISDDDKPDYMRCQILIGMKRLLGNNCVDLVKIPHIYDSYTGSTSELYGKGFNYTRILKDDDKTDRDLLKITHQIQHRYFDLVIFGSMHRGLSMYEQVKCYYPPEKMVFICGEDTHNTQKCINFVPSSSFLFLREDIGDRKILCPS